MRYVYSFLWQEPMALKPIGTWVAFTTTMSRGKRVFTARGIRSQGMEDVDSRALASACTPASVRPAPVHFTGWHTTVARAFSNVSATVTAFFCTCQPW